MRRFDPDPRLQIFQSHTSQSAIPSNRYCRENYSDCRLSLGVVSLDGESEAQIESASINFVRQRSHDTVSLRRQAWRVPLNCESSGVNLNWKLSDAARG
jgi:hypothetical protein